MAINHFITPTVPDNAAVTVRYGAGSGTGNQVTQAEVGKFCKLAAESRYDNCVVGDLIEGIVYAVELAPQNGFTIASVLTNVPTLSVQLDGIQATPGTGTVAIGDFVVCGTPVAKGTALTALPKVCKATIQPGVSVPAALTDVDDHIKASMFAWRVVSLGTAGTGAVGTSAVIQRV
jgi:hypothetical protein